MGDIFDEVYDGQATQTNASGDVFDQVYADAPPEFSWYNELLSAKNSAVKAGIGTMDLVDKFSRNFNPNQLGGPRLLGLNANLLNAPSQDLGGESLTQEATRKLTDAGILGSEKAQTVGGKFLENATRGAVEGSIAGPGGAAASGILTGIGGTIGGEVGGALGNEEIGNTAGSFIANLSPVAISKIGIVEELGNQLGPMLSRLPGLRNLFGVSAVEKAVGRTISNAASDLPATEAALMQAKPGPYSKFKTVGEVANDQGLLRLEDAANNAGQGSKMGLKELEQQRGAAREASTLGGYSPTEPLYDTSKEAETILARAGEKVRQAETEAWGKLDSGALVETKVPELENQLTKQISEITFDGSIPLEGEAKGLMSTFNKVTTATEEGVTNIGALKELRSRALRIQRATAARANPVDRQANDVASAVEEHVRGLIDHNVDAGVLPKLQAEAYKKARDITRTKYALLGAPGSGAKSKNLGSKMTEKIALKGEGAMDTAVIAEGLRSPDNLSAQLKVADALGENLRPAYKQALQSELNSTHQSRWPDLVAAKRKQWEMVLSKEELNNLDAALLDIESQAQKGRTLTTGNSATNPRGTVQEEIAKGKGLAGVISKSALLSQMPALGGAAFGGTMGYNKGDGLADTAIKTTLGAVTGAALGKGLSSSANSTSALFDQILSDSLKNPQRALDVIEKAKPSGAAQAIRQAMGGAAKATIAKESNKAIDKILSGPVVSEKKESKTEPKIEVEKQDVSEKAKNEIKADPYYRALFLAESGGNPKAKNPESSASGAFQIISSTAKKLGVKDVFDLAQNFEGAKKLTEENKKRFGTNPEVLYAAHYLGATVLQKVLDNKPLSKTEAEQVRYLENVALPRFVKIYQQGV